ncbi:MAG: OmpH family outer membrane protein [Candidatus Solibacter sp.]
MSFRLALRPLAVCSALLVFGHVAAAQSKVAVINLQKAVLESAEIKAASAAMENRYQPRVTQIESLDKDIAAISQNLQTNAGKLTPQAEADLNAQGTKKQRDVQRLRDDLQADVDRDRNEILQKSATKMGDVLKKLAEEKGYDLVIDAPYAPYFKAAMEITNDLIAAYDKAYPAAAPPAKK